jgi:uncharacterized protein (UPF0261 family)
VATIALLGTLDTKGEEYAFLREAVEAAGCDTVLLDGGVIGEPAAAPDVTREEIAAAAGVDLPALIEAGPRSSVVSAMARGAGTILAGMLAEGRIHGVLGMGGSGGTSLVAGAVRDLPIGLPKLIVSTMASGDARPFVGGSDVTMMHSVVDIAGLNGVLRRILRNAAAAAAGMARTYQDRDLSPSGRPVIGATMFGVTTAAVTTARRRLEELGYEVLVFHATGAGGMSMEALMREGYITGALDVTTTELADELIGGVLSAGPERLETAGSLGLPQVVSLGSLDIANWGPIDTVPDRFRDRNLYEHNPAITLMRTSPEECGRLGEMMAAKLNRAEGPLTVFIPLRGTSAIAVAGGPFHDPEADEALIGKLKANLDPAIEVVEMDTHINDPVFATAMADTLDRHYRAWDGGRDRSAVRGRKR